MARTATRVVERERDSTQLSVHARGHKIDTYLSSDIPLERLSPEIARVIAADIDNHGGDSSWLKQPDSKITLNPPVGQNWDQSKTLRELRVTNGTAVQLSTEVANPRYPALVESQADATAQVRNAQFAPWDKNAARALTVWFLPVIVAAIMAVFAITHLEDVVLHIGGGVTAAIVGLLALTGAATVGRTPANSDVAGSLAAVAYVSIPLAVVFMVPLNNSWSFLAASVVLLVMSAVMLQFDLHPKPVHAAALVPGIAGTAGIGAIMLFSLWRQAEVDAYAATVALIALLVGGYGQVMLSKSLAKIVDPRLPDTGETDVVESMLDLPAVARTTMSQETRDAIVHQRDRIVAARHIGIGILVGTGITMTIAAVVAGVYLRYGETLRFIVFSTPEEWINMATFAVLAAALCLTCTWYRDRGQRTVGTIAATVVWGGWIAGAVLSAPTPNAILLMVAVVATLVIVAIPVLRSWSTASTMSHTARGRLQTLEKLLYCLPLPLICTLLNLAHHIRHL